MARYEGMDDLLEHVRIQLADRQASDMTAVSSGLGIPSAQYEMALNQMLSLLHDAEQLHHLLRTPEYAELPMDQLQDLVTILDKVQRELRRCEVTLQQ